MFMSISARTGYERDTYDRYQSQYRSSPVGQGPHRPGFGRSDREGRLGRITGNAINLG